MTTLTKWQQAKARMLLKHCFFGTLACSTQMKEDKDCPTAYTDMKMIGYNPEFIDTLDMDTTIFVIAHELSHIIFKHGLRRGDRNHRIWNIACDYRIDYWLHSCGFKIWEHAYFDKKFADMSEEQIYDALMKNSKTIKILQDGLGQDIREASMDAAEQAAIERAIQYQIAQAANIARMAGQLSGEIERVVGNLLEPQVPWYDLLREYLSRTAQEDESWTRRNRRIDHVILPGHYSEHMGEIIVIGDTSGSIGNSTFARVAAEIGYVIEQVKPERVRVVWADDTECAHEEIFEPGEPIVLHPKGGGGTDMCKPLKHVEQFEPIVVIMVTDGFTPWPKDEPLFPLIVCCTTNTNVPIGRVIRVTT